MIFDLSARRDSWARRRREISEEYICIKMKEDQSLKMDHHNDEEKRIILQLFDVNGIKVQDVHLKSGQISPIYIDLRVLVSFPELMVRTETFSIF